MSSILGEYSRAQLLLPARSPQASDSAGAYEISALIPGVYDVTVKPPFPGYTMPPQKVELASAETKVVDIYLDYEKTVVEGHVCDQDGKPIAGATLSGVLAGKEIGTMSTDEQGHFMFEGVTQETDLFE